MFAEFIDRPIAGQFPEKHFGDTSPSPKWIKFTDKNYLEWVASLKNGWEKYATLIINFEFDERAFVIAGGYGYLIDTAKRDLISIPLPYITAAIADTQRKRVIFSTGYNLQCLDFAGHHTILYNERYFDDIEFVEIRNNKLFANYWYYQRNTEPFLFEIDLETNEVKDSYPDNMHVEDNNEQSKLTTLQRLLKRLRL